LGCVTIDGVRIKKLYLLMQLGITSNYSALVDLNTLQIITASDKPFPACCVFASRYPVTASNSGDTSSSRSQVLLLQPPASDLMSTVSSSYLPMPNSIVLPTLRWGVSILNLACRAQYIIGHPTWKLQLQLRLMFITNYEQKVCASQSGNSCYNSLGSNFRFSDGFRGPSTGMFIRMESLVQYFVHRISVFFDFIHRLVFFWVETRRFRNWICFRPQVNGGEETPTQLDPLERANLNHWSRWHKLKTPLILCTIRHRSGSR
jgi:hypothetical protein